MGESPHLLDIPEGWQHVAFTIRQKHYQWRLATLAFFRRSGATFHGGSSFRGGGMMDFGTGIPRRKMRSRQRIGINGGIGPE